MANMKNTLINYEKREVGDYIVADYTTKKFKDISEYLNSSDPALYDTYVMKEDDKLERISQELYGTPDYWDILLLINFRDPLFELPLNFDALSNITDDKVQSYISDVYKTVISDGTVSTMTEKYLADFETNNEIFSILKIVKPSRIYEFLQGGYEGGYF